MIKFADTYIKPIAIFLSIIVLFQCCIVYDKKPVTIDEAINELMLSDKTIQAINRYTDPKSCLFIGQ